MTVRYTVIQKVDSESKRVLDQSADVAEEGDRDRHAVSSPARVSRPTMYHSLRGEAASKSCTLPVHTHGPWRNTLSAYARCYAGQLVFQSLSAGASQQGLFAYLTYL
jgi:hypothetical protein